MKKIITILVLVFLCWTGSARADYLGQIGVAATDSLDLIYWGLDPYGNVTTPESVWVWIYKDSTGGATQNVDSLDLPVGTLPSRLIRTGQAWLRHYSVRVKSSNGKPGKYHAFIVTDESIHDTSWLPIHYSWDAVDTLTQTYLSLLFHNQLSPTTVKRTLDVTANGNAGIDWGNIDNKGSSVGLTSTAISQVTQGVTVSTNNDKTGYSIAVDGIIASAFGDNAQYMVYGGAVWVDTANGTAGTVVGVNGLPSLPCRGFEKAKIIADAIGVTKFCVLGGGDQILRETLNGYTFVGIGDAVRNKIDLNSQDVGGCVFVDLFITGIQGGDRATFVLCALEDVSINAAAIQCGLRGDITLLGDRDNIFAACASSVPGGLTPSLIFSGGSESVLMRGYSGGIHLYNMGANDTLSFEAIGGQLQIGASVNVNAKITARGMITVTDSTAGLNNLTYIATAQYAVDSTMNAITATNKANFKADVTSVTVGAFAADAIDAPAFADDAAFIPYGGGVWVGTGSNTNTVVGVDGLPTNPVSTIAAAKTIADAIGSRTIYFMDGVNKTISATMEHYRFIGVTNFPDVTLSLNGQDVDFSLFENMILTGVQGGTGLLCAIHCAFNNTDSLKATATGCAFLGDVSLESGTDSYFDQCYSGIAGNLTPTLTFGGSGSATENVNFRHYSGGLHLRTMTATDIISFEAIGGQLLVGADCHASATVTARGMITLYDSAGVNLTYVATAQYMSDSLRAVLDSIQAHAPHDDNWGGTATDLSVEIDSILAAIYDRTNDTSFIRILSQYVLALQDTVNAHAPHDDNWGGVGAGGVDLSDEVDSLLAAIYDRTNDTSFVRIITQYVLLRLHPDSLRAFLATHDSTLLEQAAACGSGIGDNTTIIYVLNAADSTTGISGFAITIQDSTSGEFKAYGTTNTSGVDTFSLPDGTFKISMSKTSWSINTPVYKGTAGDSTWTFYATAYDPGNPPSAEKCNVWTLISDLSASWLAGCRLTIWIPSRYSPLTFDTTLVSPYTVDAVSNDTGFVVVAVYRSAELTAGNGQTVKMYIEARAPNGDLLGRTFKEIPDQGSWEIIW